MHNMSRYVVCVALYILYIMYKNIDPAMLDVYMLTTIILLSRVCIQNTINSITTGIGHRYIV